MSHAVKIPPYHHIWRYIYTFILSILLPIILLLSRKKLSQKTVSTNEQSDILDERRFSERFGVLNQRATSVDILVHCVSVGELNAASPLIARLLVDYPDYKIMVTTTSVTGAIHAYGLFKQKVQHHFLPIDIPFFIGRFLKKVAPKLVCITEVEIWPNLVNACWENNIPICLLNARMSDKSVPTYRKLSKLFRPTLRKFTYICAQNQSSYDNFLSVGIYKSQLRLCHNMKFDISLDAADTDKGEVLAKHFALTDKLVIVVASSHDPEEKLLLSSYSSLQKKHPNLVLIVVPRHPHRFGDVYELCSASGFITEKLSDHVDDAGQVLKVSNATPNILVLNAMGWLKAAYSVCNIAFIGGSFVEKGGHNALECAAYGKPMLMGPSIFNNPGICKQLSQSGALSIVENEEALTKQCGLWLQCSDKAVSAGNAGKDVVTGNRGAVDATLTLLHPLLGNFLRN